MIVYPRNTNKGGWSYFHFDAVEVRGVSELNTLVLQNNCLLYSWIFKGFFMSHCAELQSVVYQKFIKLMIPPNMRVQIYYE